MVTNSIQGRTVAETRRTQGCEAVLTDLTRVPFTISPMKSMQEILREAVQLAAQETWRLPWELPTGPYNDFKHAASQARLSRSKQTTLWNHSTFKDQWKARPSDSPERLQKQLGRMAFTLALSVTRNECIVMLAQWLKRYGRNYNPLHLLEVTNTAFSSWKVQDSLQEKTLTNTLKNQRWREAQRAKAGRKKRTTQKDVLAALPATKAELVKALGVSVDSIDGHLRRMHFEGKVEEVSTGRWVVASEYIVNP